MKSAAISAFCLVYIVGHAFGEQTGYDYRPVKKEETEVEVQKVEVYEVPWIGDQKPQSGYGTPDQQYNPPSQEFTPPQEYGPPPQEYGPPPQEYGPPPQEYGPPESTSEYPELTTTISPINTTNTTEVSKNNTQEQTAKLQELSGIENNGQYYIYHPSGLLQKVIYVTKDDSKNMAFSAQLKYKNVDPIKGPIYTYDPESYVFSRINRK